jgi:hypothetical protein
VREDRVKNRKGQGFERNLSELGKVCNPKELEVLIAEEEEGEEGISMVSGGRTVQAVLPNRRGV